MSTPDWNPPGGQLPWKDGDTTPEIRVGSLYGFRSFAATQDGHLTGVTFREPWQPGPNTSTCWRVTHLSGVPTATSHSFKILAKGTAPPPSRLATTDYMYIAGANYHAPDLTHADYHDSRTASGITAPPTRTSFEAWHARQTGDTRPWKEWWGVVAPPAEGHNMWGPGFLRDYTWLTHKPTVEYGGQVDPDHTPAGCHCGYHGYLEGSSDFAAVTGRVSGIVRAWGVMSLGSHGFRAQHAEIVALYVPPAGGEASGPFTVRPSRQGYGPGVIQMFQAPPPPSGDGFGEGVAAVRERYQVPFFTSLSALLAEFPTTPPREKKEDDDG